MSAAEHRGLGRTRPGPGDVTPSHSAARVLGVSLETGCPKEEVQARLRLVCLQPGPGAARVEDTAAHGHWALLRPPEVLCTAAGRQRGCGSSPRDTGTPTIFQRGNSTQNQLLSWKITDHAALQTHKHNPCEKQTSGSGAPVWGEAVWSPLTPGLSMSQAGFSGAHNTLAREGNSETCRTDSRVRPTVHLPRMLRTPR